MFFIIFNFIHFQKDEKLNQQERKNLPFWIKLEQGIYELFDMINLKKFKHMNLPGQSMFEDKYSQFKIKEEMFKLYESILERK